MGTFAKIFIVVNLVLAVVFLGAASTLLGTIEDWKGKWQDTDQLLKAEQEARKAEVKQLSEDVNSLKAQKTTLTNDNQRHLADEKERNEEWQALKEQFNQQGQTLLEYSKAIKDLERDLASARTANEALQGQYETALDDTRKAKGVADDLRSDLERLGAEMKRTEADLAQTQKDKTELAEKVEKQANLIAMVNERLGADWIKGIQDMPAIDGQVTGTDEELNIVLISVGTDDNVKVGFTMTVFRGGEYVGKLVIDKVGPDWASGHMDRGVSKSFPMKGDSVATQL